MKKKSGEKEIYELRLTRLTDAKSRDKTRFYGVIRPLEKFEVKKEIFADTAKKLEDSLAASHQGIWQWLAALDRATLINTHIGLSQNEETEVSFEESSFLDRVYPRDRVRVGLTWRHFLEGNDDYYHDEYRILNKNDIYIWVSSKGKVMERKSDARPLRIAGTISDISEEKENREIILRQTQKLVDYAFMNSHLFRGPVTSIIGLVDLILEEKNFENVLKLKDVAEQLDRTIHQINQMITETGKEFRLTKANVSHISLISNDNLKNLILKASLEHYQPNIELSVNENHQEYLLTNPQSQLSDLVILDEESCDDVMEFLNNYEKKEPKIPIYLLVAKLDLSMIEQLNQFSSVQGIILKSGDHRRLLEFIENLNN